jgi:hypothetical protein
MKYQIIYQNGKDKEVLNAETQEECDAYVNVLKALGVNYVVEEKFLVCIVSFQNRSNKSYTYLSKKKYKTGDCVIVQASEWINGTERPCLKVVTVLGCGYRSRAELEEVLPFYRYKYIVGEVTTA